MSARVYGMLPTVTGAVLVSVTAELYRRLPTLVIEGVPAARERAETVRNAILASGFDFPRQRIVVSVTAHTPAGEVPLTPEVVRTPVYDALDLAMATAVLAVSGQCTPMTDGVYYGGLQMDGSITPARGVLRCARVATDRNLSFVAKFATNVHGALPLDGRFPHVDTLAQVATLPPVWQRNPEPPPAPAHPLASWNLTPDNQRRLMIAAAGKRPVLLVAPNGARATELARVAGAMHGMQPPALTWAREVHDLAGLDIATVTAVSPPYRAPHYTISPAGLVGNTYGAPGEVALACGGTLVLDNVGAFPQFALDAIDAWLDAHANDYPVAPWIVGIAAPCPCGGAANVCTCNAAIRKQYADTALAKMRLARKGAPVIVVDVPPYQRGPLPPLDADNSG